MQIELILVSNKIAQIERIIDLMNNKNNLTLKQEFLYCIILKKLEELKIKSNELKCSFINLCNNNINKH